MVTVYEPLKEYGIKDCIQCFTLGEHPIVIDAPDVMASTTVSSG